jgi:hypothetical protein
LLHYCKPDDEENWEGDLPPRAPASGRREERAKVGRDGGKVGRDGGKVSTSPGSVTITVSRVHYISVKGQR